MRYECFEHRYSIAVHDVSVKVTLADYYRRICCSHPLALLILRILAAPTCTVMSAVLSIPSRRQSPQLRMPLASVYACSSADGTVLWAPSADQILPPYVTPSFQELFPNASLSVYHKLKNPRDRFKRKIYHPPGLSGGRRFRHRNRTLGPSHV